MTYDELANLVKQGESDTLEFKSTTSQLDKAARTLCGFLNGQGGTVLIGVSDKGALIGQEVADSTKQMLADVLLRFEPSHDITVSYIKLPNSNKQILVLRAILHEDRKPYSYEGRGYIREQSTTRVMSQTQYQRLLLKKETQPTSWDAFINTNFTIMDLDEKRVIDVLKRGIKKGRIPSQFMTENVLEALNYLKLIKKGQLTNAAVVLFAKDLGAYLIQCMIKLAAFADDTRRRFIDSKQECGNLFDLLELAATFISHHTRVGSYFLESQLERVDVPDYPPIAIREALINALCHRDYANPSGSAVVSIYPSKLEIASFGRLPPGYTTQEIIEQHQSMPRNAHIADVLYRCGYIEKYGSGLNQILRECEEANVASPVFEETGAFFTVIFEKAQVNELIKPSIDVAGDKGGKLTLRQIQILTFLQEHGALKNQQLLDYLTNFGEVISSRTLQEDLKRLYEKGFITKYGATRGTIWEAVKRK